MQLLTQLICIGPLINKFPDIVYLFICTRFKAWGVVENKVAPRVCDLMLNIVCTSLQSCCMSTQILCSCYWQVTSIEDVTCGAEGATFDLPLNLCLTRASSLGLPGLTPISTPSWSYVIRADPGATPQTFSRIVVLPALALPMMRIRK